MIGLSTTAEIRTAEAPLLAGLPDGALMQRAATGLAPVCLRLLGSPYGRRVVLLVGSGNNGGDALDAGAHLRGVDGEIGIHRQPPSSERNGA